MDIWLYLLPATLIGFAYLMGSLSTAIIVCHMMSLPDPRNQGSGNPGATNVLRVAGKPAAAITLLGDILKGAAPVVITATATQSHTTIYLSALAATLGHTYPVFFNFRGGKGVATGLGALHVISLPTALCVDLLWLFVAGITRYSSLAAVLSWAFAPIFCWFFSPAFTPGVLLISVLLISRHKRNIQHLFAGTENKIGERATTNY